MSESNSINLLCDKFNCFNSRSLKNSLGNLDILFRLTLILVNLSNFPISLGSEVSELS